MIHFLLSSDEVYKFMYNDVRKIPNVLTSERRRKKMKDFFEELGKYIGETATTVGNKAGEVIETQKLKSQVRSLTHENTVDLLELGRGVYEQYKSGAG